MKKLILYLLCSGPAFMIFDRNTFAAYYWPLVELAKHTSIGKPLKEYWIFCDELFLSDEARGIERSLGIREIWD